MECRGFCLRLGLRVCDVPLMCLYYSTARFCGVSRVMAFELALHALDYPTKAIATAGGCRAGTVREALRVGRGRIGARDRGDCVRILQEPDAERRHELQTF